MRTTGDFPAKGERPGEPLAFNRYKRHSVAAGIRQKYLAGTVFYFHDPTKSLLWSAKIELRTSRCEEILVMQSAKDRLGSDGVRFSAAMARIWMRVVAIGGRGIWDAWTQRHMRTRGIVVRNPV